MKYKALISLIMVASALASCATPTPQVVEKVVTQVIKQVVTEVVKETVKETVIVEGTPQVVEKEVTKVVEVEKVVTATPEPEPEPAVGGTLVYILGYEMDTLDVHKSGRLFPVCQYMGGGLIIKDPWTGEYLPYLAESWTVAEDGMSYEFKLREDVKFHDGTPLTAHDYAWSFNRAKDPKTKSPTSGPSLNGLAIAEAVDDYTLRFRMGWPNSALMNTLSGPCYHQPLSQAYVEQMGEDYGRHPIGVGPFKFKEWVTGEKIVLERNPDFTWGPEWTRGGPPYIETIEFRIIPEYATQLAGLETGELDYISPEIKDLERIESIGQFQIFSAMSKGCGTHVAMNTTKPPFDDIRVRQAFNHAIDRKTVTQIVTLGHAPPLYGSLTPSTLGYWPGVEYIGYHYNLDKAKALMAEAGYTPGSDGWLEKDGQPLVVSLKIASNWTDDVKAAEILKEQFKALGVQVELEQMESGVLYDVLASGDYEMTIETLGWPDFGIMFAMLHSSMVGAWNRARVTDMDDMIYAMTGATNDKQLEEAATETQKHIVEQAYFAPLYAGKWHIALSNRVKGALFSELTQHLYLYDAYIETTVP